MQGFSGVLAGPNGSYQMLVDNGFGAESNSGDALLRMYAVQVDWSTKSVSTADFKTGAVHRIKGTLPFSNAALASADF